MTTILDSLKTKIIEGIAPHAAGITVEAVKINETIPHCFKAGVKIRVSVCDDEGKPLAIICERYIHEGDTLQVLDIDRAFDIRLS